MKLIQMINAVMLPKNYKKNYKNEKSNINNYFNNYKRIDFVILFK